VEGFLTIFGVSLIAWFASIGEAVWEVIEAM
jgi:hypothetical protein